MEKKNKGSGLLFPISLAASSNSAVSAPPPQFSPRVSRRRPGPSRPSAAPPPDWLAIPRERPTARAARPAPHGRRPHPLPIDWLHPESGLRRAPPAPPLTAAVPRARAAPSTASRAKAAQNRHIDPTGGHHALSRYLPAAWSEVSPRLFTREVPAPNRPPLHISRLASYRPVSMPRLP